MKKIIPIFLLAVFMATLATAYHYGYDYDDNKYHKEKISKTYYDPYHNSATTKTTEVYYKNKYRYSTDKYDKYGYTYRTSLNYWNDHHDYWGNDYDSYKKPYTTYKKPYKKYYSGNHHDSYPDYSTKKGYYKDWDDYYDFHPDHKSTYVKYTPYLREAKEFECYEHAPHGKFFYKKCP